MKLITYIVCLYIYIFAPNFASAVVVDVPESHFSNIDVIIKQSSEKASLTSFLEQNTPVNAPSFPYWENVGKVGMGSGIYLGGGMVLTSAHVECYPFLMSDGSYYKPVYKSYRVLLNSDGTRSDLAVFKIQIQNENAAINKLPTIPVSVASPGKNKAIVMIAAGLNQSEKISALRSNGKILAILGYHTAAKRNVKWGWNSVFETPGKRIKTASFQTHAFTTNFDNDGERTAQAVSGDSGGAAFTYNEDQKRWELAGCIFAVSQKGNFVPKGSKTYLANLSAYFDQFPETNRKDSRGVALTGRRHNSGQGVGLIEVQPSLISAGGPE